MFVGHFGVALAAKRAAPKGSLATFIFAAEYLDLVWPIFLLLGIEHVRIAPGITKVSPLDLYDYPVSHSLLTVLGWSALIGILYFAIRRYGRGAWTVALAVLSHWVLDFISHRPDMPLWPGGPRVGLGLWNSWPASIVVEVLILGIGLWIYLRTTRPRDAVGRYGFWALVALLLFGWIGSMAAGPPPSVSSLAWGGLTMWLTVVWGWWADSHRTAVPPQV
jgi:hypothetical protein